VTSPPIDVVEHPNLHELHEDVIVDTQVPASSGSRPKACPLLGRLALFEIRLSRFLQLLPVCLEGVKGRPHVQGFHRLGM
jgi:hypothetical protein